MKRNLFYSLLFLMLVFTGCSQKDVEIDTAEDTVKTDNMDQYSNEQRSTDSESNLDKIDAVEQTVVDESSVVDVAAEEASDKAKKEIFDPILFAFDKFNLSPEMLNTARANSTKLMALGNVSVKLEGNCDEWGSDEYNYALGLKRASTVKDILTADGFNTANISMVSYGESNPVCSEHNEACWAQNRRVDYKLQ